LQCVAVRCIVAARVATTNPDNLNSLLPCSCYKRERVYIKDQPHQKEQEIMKFSKTKKGRRGGVGGGVWEGGQGKGSVPLVSMT